MLLPVPLTAIAVPFLLAVGMAGLARAGMKNRKAPDLTGCAIGVGFVGGFVAIARGVPFLASVPHHYVGSAAIVATLAGAATAWCRIQGRWLTPALLIAALATVAWCFGVDQIDLIAADDLWLLALVCAVSALLMVRLLVLAASGATPVAVLGVMSLGLAAVAATSHAGLSGTMAVALAAACAGWLVWARPYARTEAGVAALLIGGSILIAVGTEIVRTGLHTPWAIALLPACLWADRLAARFPVFARLGRLKAWRPIATTLAASVPALASAALALILAYLRAPTT